MARTLKVEILGDSKSLERTFNRAGRSAKQFNGDLSKSTRGVLSATVGFRGLGRALTFASTSFLAGAGITAFLKQASQAASNLAEQIDKTKRVFGAASKTVLEFANNALGLARDKALETASSIGALLKPLGVVGKQSASLSDRLTQMGVDLASFFNTDVSDSLDALRSGLVGQARPLRRYAILLDAARVNQEALRESGKQSVKQLSNQDKVLARINLIFKDGAQAVGNYQATIGELANQQREFEKNIGNLEEAIGQTLNPTIIEVTKSLNKFLSNEDNVAKLQKNFREIVGAAKDLAKAVSDVAKAAGGFKNLIGILIGLKIATVLRRWAFELGLLTVAENGAAVGALRLRAATIASTLAFGRAAAATVVLRAGFVTLGAAAIVSAAAILTKFKKVRDLLDSLKDSASGKGSLLDILAGPPGNRGALGNLVFPAHRPTPESKLDKSGPAPASLADNERRSRFSDIAAARKEVEDLVRRRKRGLTAAQLNSFFDDALSRALDRVQDLKPKAGLAKLAQIAALITQQIAKVKDVTRKLTLRDRLLEVQRQSKALREQIAADFLDSLQLGFEQAQFSKGFADDLAALDKIQAQIQRQIAAEGKTTDLERKLLEVRQERADVLRQQAEALAERRQKALDARNARQFKALGLGPTGDALVPATKALRASLSSISDAVKGTFLDTSKTKSLLAHIRKVLSGGLGAISADVRAKIKEMLDSLDQQLKEHSGDRATKFRKLNIRKALEAIGLTPEQIRAVAALFARAGAGGAVAAGGPGAFGMALSSGNQLVIHNTLELDGKVAARSTTKHQQKRARRNPQQKRGR